MVRKKMIAHRATRDVAEGKLAGLLLLSVVSNETIMKIPSPNLISIPMGPAGRLHAANAKSGSVNTNT
jgi:hypothetical protein